MQKEYLINSRGDSVSPKKENSLGLEAITLEGNTKPHRRASKRQEKSSSAKLP